MALNAYMTIKGQKQGNINGSVTQKGRENSILVHYFNQEIDSPRDAQSGLPTGKRQHKPIAIIKEIDKSSPLLLNALVSNENLMSVQVQFWQIGATAAGIATEKLMYTVTLTNASIASLQQTMLDNEDPARSAYPLREELSFTYQKIAWTWNDGGVTAGDDWESPVI